MKVDWLSLFLLEFQKLSFAFLLICVAEIVNPIHHELFWAKTDLSMKLSSQRHMPFASIVFLFPCLVCVTSGNFCWENLDIDQVNTIFQISEKVRTNEPLPPKDKVLENSNFNPKTLINFRNFMKVSFSQNPWYSHNKQKNLVRTQCTSHPWRIELNKFQKIWKPFGTSSGCKEITFQAITKKCKKLLLF